MSREPVVREDRIRHVWGLLLISFNFNVSLFDLFFESFELIDRSLGRLSLIHLSLIHEFVVSKCFFVQEEVSRFHHQHSMCELCCESALRERSTKLL